MSLLFLHFGNGSLETVSVIKVEINMPCALLKSNQSSPHL